MNVQKINNCILSNRCSKQPNVGKYGLYTCNKHKIIEETTGGIQSVITSHKSLISRLEAFDSIIRQSTIRCLQKRQQQGSQLSIPENKYLS